MLLIFLSLLLVSVLFYYYLICNFDYWKKREVPFPKPVIFMGNFMPDNKKHLIYKIDRYYNEYKSKTPFLGLFQFRTPKLLLIDPELIKNVMIKNFTSFHDNEFSGMSSKGCDPLFARNPAFLGGKEWKEKRAEITPALTKNRLKAMFPIVETITKKFITYVEKILNEGSDTIFDARNISAKYTCDVVSNCAFGVDAQSFEIENPEILTMGQKIIKPSIRTQYVFLLYLVAPNLAKLLKICMIPKKIENFFIQLIKDAIHHRDENKTERRDYLEYLINLRDKKGIAPIDIAAHGMTFFTDGFETSSIAIAHAFYELGKNKDVQSKLRDEILDNFGKDGPLTFEKLNELCYLDQVFNETLRMHSPGLLTSRKCTKSTELESASGASVFVERDMNIMISIYSLHYDCQYYENPTIFNPDRFEGNKVKKYISDGYFLPFGAGPRICLGRNFLSMQAKAIIAEVVRNFEISVNSKTQEPLEIDVMGVLNIPRGGLWLNFEKYNSN